MSVEKFELEESEKFNPLWLKLQKHFESEIERLRKINDNESNDERQTAVIRGQLKTLKILVKLGDRPPNPTVITVGHDVRGRQ